MRYGVRAFGMLWLAAFVSVAVLSPPRRSSPATQDDWFLPTLCNPVLDGPSSPAAATDATLRQISPRTRWLNLRRLTRPFLRPSKKHALGFTFPIEDEHWRSVTRGGAFRRLALRSPGAGALRVHLTGVNLPPGVELRIYGVKTHPHLPREVHAARGPFGDGELWSDLVPGDTLFLEWGRDTTVPPFRLEAVTHFRPKAALEVFLEEFEPVPHCFENAPCHPTREMRAAVRLLYQAEDRNKDGTVSRYPGVVSGFLLTTPEGDYAPLAATAAHGISSEAMARSVQAFWRYQTEGCESMVLTEGWAASPTGARLVAVSRRQDLTLLEILGATPRGLCYGGWTTAPPAAGETFFAYHFPGGGLPALDPAASWLRVTVGEILETVDLEDVYESLGWYPSRRLETAMRLGGIFHGSSGGGVWRTINGRHYLFGLLSLRSNPCPRPDRPALGILGAFGPLTRRMVEQFVRDTSPACAPDDAGTPPLITEGLTRRGVVVTQNRPATVTVRLGAPGWWRVCVAAPRAFGDVGVEVVSEREDGTGWSPAAATVVASPAGETAAFQSFRPGQVVVVRLFLRNDTRAVCDVDIERHSGAEQHQTGSATKTNPFFSHFPSGGWLSAALPGRRVFTARPG